MKPTKYNNPQVALHWLTAAVILFMLVAGALGLANMENADPDKIGALRIHMVLGVLVFMLTLGRIVWRVKTEQPKPMQSGNAMLDKLGVSMHYVLYLITLVIAASGVSLAIAAGLPDVVFFGQGALPADFFDFLPRYMHGISTKLMMGLILLHIMGGVYHAIASKTRRMWFR
ncbi:MAG: cytochrome b/b6 domain-containing protein [Rhodospirillaceae bacterium]|nr:cytochrome b/b6 domain-containing protein [Rhodospirillaceae bacterium]